MLQITATELARKFKQMMNLVEFQGEELIIVRNNRQVAKIIPGPATMTALEAMSDLYRTLPEDAGATRQGFHRYPRIGVACLITRAGTE